MRGRALHTAIALLTIAVVAILFFTVEDPLLYSPERSPPSPFHENLALKGSPTAGSETLLLLMDEVLDATGTITLSLKADDLVAAQRDLEEYLVLSDRLDGLVIELNLSSSEVEDFRRHNQQNLQDLQEIVNSTVRFSELERLEITYREEGNPERLYAVSYEGETIRQRALEISREYTAREQTVVITSRSFDLNTIDYEESVTSFAAITQKISAQQDERRILLGDVPPLASRNLTLSIHPPTVMYGDSLVWSGDLTGGITEGIPLTLYIDSIRIAETRTGEKGLYRYLFPIQRIRRGTHLVYVAADRTYSPIVPFLVTATATTLTIGVIAEEENRVVISGTLTARTLPVPRAPITLTLDSAPPIQVETDMEGTYRMSLNLTEGTHLARAQFSSRDLPLLPSAADISITMGTAPHPTPLAVFILLTVVCISILLAFWYLYRRSRQELVVVPVLPSEGRREEETFSVIRVSPERTEGIQVPLSQVQILFGEGRIEEAILHLYRYLTAMLGARCRISSFRSLTPREFAVMVEGAPFSPALWQFMNRYEGVRYGGEVLTEDALSTLTSLVNTIETAAGGGED